MSLPIGPSQPSIGRIVHVYLPPVTVPAIVTAVLGSEGLIACTLFPPGAQPICVEAEHDESGKPHTWHWPKVVR